jgi:hypothetical protein
LKNVCKYAQKYFTLQGKVTKQRKKKKSEDNGGSDGGVGFDDNDDDDNDEECGDDCFADGNVFDDAMVMLTMMVKANILMIRC